MEIKDLVYKKLAKLTKQKFDNSSSVYAIGIDSLDLVELVTDAEDELGVTISDADLEKIKTVGDVVEALKKAGA